MSEDSNHGDFSGYISQERARLEKEREEIFSQQNQLEERLGGVSRELAAIDAYESMKAGRAVAPSNNGRRRGSNGGGRRGRPQGRGTAVAESRRGSKRDALLTVIRDNPNGVSRGEILTKMGLKGDKSGEMSVSNALTALIKSKQIERHDGKYMVAAAA